MSITLILSLYEWISKSLSFSLVLLFPFAIVSVSESLAQILFIHASVMIFVEVKRSPELCGRVEKYCYNAKCDA